MLDSHITRRCNTGKDVRTDMIEHIHKQLRAHNPRRLNISAPEAAVLIPITRSSTDPEIVFTRRATRLNTHGGEVAFPGGKRDPCDPDLVHTALRESHEEIGLRGDQVNVLGSTGEVVSRFGIKVTPFVGVIDPNVELVANPDELDRIFRVPVSYFLEQDRLRIDQLRYRGVVFQVPAWQFEEYTIWGLTAIMLVEFLNVTLDAGLPLDVPQIRAAIQEKGHWSCEV